MGNVRLPIDQQPLPVKVERALDGIDAAHPHGGDCAAAHVRIPFVQAVHAAQGLLQQPGQVRCIACPAALKQQRAVGTDGQQFIGSVPVQVQDVHALDVLRRHMGQQRGRAVGGEGVKVTLHAHRSALAGQSGDAARIKDDQSVAAEEIMEKRHIRVPGLHIGQGQKDPCLPAFVPLPVHYGGAGLAPCSLIPSHCDILPRHPAAQPLRAIIPVQHGLHGLHLPGFQPIQVDAGPGLLLRKDRGHVRLFRHFIGDEVPGIRSGGPQEHTIPARGHVPKLYQVPLPPPGGHRHTAPVVGVPVGVVIGVVVGQIGETVQPPQFRFRQVQPGVGKEHRVHLPDGQFVCGAGLGPNPVKFVRGQGLLRTARAAVKQFVQVDELRRAVQGA